MRRGRHGPGEAAVWYRASERFLLRYGRWPLVLALLGLIGISAVFLVQVLRGRWAIPAAAWVTYMYMP